MDSKIIDGKKISSEIITKLKEDVQEMREKPFLAAILLGENPASKIYVSRKEKKSLEVGFKFKKILLPKETSEKELLEKIDELNRDERVHGIIVQLPLPKQINESKIINSIKEEKDVDGFSSNHLGKLLVGQNSVVSATPKGIMRLIESTGATLSGKEAVIVGRSNIVGKPLFVLLQQRGCTVTLCHSKTKNLEKHTKRADILVVAVGKSEIVGKEMVKKGAIVIDVGITKENGKLKGDVNFEEVKDVADFITPVPGGVGPMTIAMLLENTLDAAKRSGQRK